MVWLAGCSSGERTLRRAAVWGLIGGAALRRNRAFASVCWHLREEPVEVTIPLAGGDSGGRDEGAAGAAVLHDRG